MLCTCQSNQELKRKKIKKIKDRPIDYLGRIQGISVCINVYPLIFHTPPKTNKKSYLNWTYEGN